MVELAATGFLKDLRDAIPLMSRELRRRTEDRGSVYYTGNGSDFDDFSVPLVEAMGDAIIGVGCVTLDRISSNPKVMETAEDHFAFPFEYFEDPTEPCDVLMIAQAIIASEKEITAIMTRSLNQIGARSVMIVTAALAEDARDELISRHRYLSERSFLSRWTVRSEMDLRRAQDDWYQSVDQRTRKTLPIIPRWIRDRDRKMENRPTLEP